MREAGGAPQATLIGGGMKVPVVPAVLANGTIGHVAEFDDGHTLAMTHPGAVSVPSSLAVAEYAGAGGRDLLTGVVVGYEVMVRLGIAVNPSHYRFWHTTGTCGTFAAAAAASSILKLDRQKVRTALGISGTMAAGLQETFGTFAKPLNAGHACQSGVLAALLARKGFSGPDDVLTGDKGFLRAMSSDPHPAALTDGLGGEFFIRTAGYKIYSSCGHTFAPLNALFLLMQGRDLDAEEIEEIEVATYGVSVDLTGQFKNGTAEQAKFSLPFCLAVALLHKKVSLPEFSAAMLRDPRIARLAGKITIREDEEMTRRFPGDRMAVVRIRLRDGRVLQESVVKPAGPPARSVLEEKFLSLAGMQFDQGRAREILESVLRLDEMDTIDPLMKMLM
ncbi:MAG: 2-methylcitrate dehydratase [Syntrophaceae bacterium PtaU1.Bin231]|nr:MAG: 2-methylcitrate dehydratase [Syntrophaceae bacterium PtaU1.Bin231]